MTKARLLSTVAIALLLTVGAASAQTMKKDEAPAPAPAAQQTAPAEKVAPNMKAGEKNAEIHKAPETVGQAPKGSDADKTRATDKGAVDKGADNAAEKSGVKSSADVKPTPDANGTADVKSKAETKSNENTAQTKPDAKASQSTTGQGAAAGSAKLSTEQRSKITSVIRQQKVVPTKLSVSISVGTRIPGTVHYYPLPQEVFVIYPEWRGYDYILVGDEIVIIDPRTHEIVAIIEA